MSQTPQTPEPTPEIQGPDLARDLEDAARKEIESSLEKLQIENDRLRQELKEAKDVHQLRKDYSGKLFSLIVVWLIFVLVYVGLAASTGGRFRLAESVLIAFITSTTVSVLGLFLLVAKWLFPSSHKDETEGEKHK
jgi:hypothetical protein